MWPTVQISGDSLSLHRLTRFSLVHRSGWLRAEIAGSCVVGPDVAHEASRRGLFLRLDRLSDWPQTTPTLATRSYPRGLEPGFRNPLLLGTPYYLIT